MKKAIIYENTYGNTMKGALAAINLIRDNCDPEYVIHDIFEIYYNLGYSHESGFTRNYVVYNDNLAHDEVLYEYIINSTSKDRYKVLKEDLFLTDKYKEKAKNITALI